MTYFRAFTYVPVFILLFILFGCANLEHQNENIIKTDEGWKNKTINKVMSGYNMENNYFIDYNEKTVKLTIDEVWRSIEIYNLVSYGYDEELLLKSISDITPSNDREKLEYDYICKVIGQEKCEITYNNDYNILVEELLNQNFNIDEEMYETLDIFYIIVNNFPNELNKLSKSRIASWILENQEKFQDDIGLLYSILRIENGLNREFIAIENKKKYEQSLEEVINNGDSDLIEIYYLYFINVYLQNSYDKELILKKTAEYYNNEYGFSLSTNEYVDGNLGSYLGVKILSSLGETRLLKTEMIELLESNEAEYGGFINKENIPSGSVEETIMANYILEELSGKRNVTSENMDLNNLNWYWTYYGLLQYDDQITVESKENILRNLEMFEYEILNTEFTEEVYKQLVTSSGVMNEVEYFSKVGMLVDYPFDNEFKKKLEEISNKLVGMITTNDISVLSSIIALNGTFALNLDEQMLEPIIKEAIKNNNPNNFYEWHSVIKAATLIGVLKSQDLNLHKYLNYEGGVYGDLKVESSDTLFSTFLMLSLVKISEE